MSDSDSSNPEMTHSVTIAKRQALLRNACFAGDVMEAKALLSDPTYFWQPDQVYSDARAVCDECEELLDPSEDVIKWWAINSVNSVGKYQERLIMITTKNFIRVKIDFTKKAILRFEKTPLEEIEYVHHGKIVMNTSKFDPASFMVKKQPEQFGLRYTKRVPLPKPGEDIPVLRDDDRFRTFVPILGTNVVYSMEDVAAEIALTLTVARHALAQSTNSDFSPDVFISNTNIQMFVKGSVMSLFHNSLGLGSARP
ncbi:hypothetical protein GEMRC1_002877 [Eukaryota sp. GEM-RC1]